MGVLATIHKSVFSLNKQLNNTLELMNKILTYVTIFILFEILNKKIPFY